MNIYLTIALVAAVFFVLVAGIVLMAIGGETNKRFSNKLMWARVILQAIAIAIILYAIS